LAFVTGIIACAAIHACHAGETLAEELAFQLVHTLDAAQTLDIRHHANLQESGAVLDAGWAIGHHPSDHAVYAYMGAEASLHAGITYAMVRLNAPRWATRTWEAVTIAVDASTVAHNASIGLRIHL
jgi:hypothetical protein